MQLGSRLSRGSVELHSLLPSSTRRTAIMERFCQMSAGIPLMMYRSPPVTTNHQWNHMITYKNPRIPELALNFASRLLCTAHECAIGEMQAPALRDMSYVIAAGGTATKHRQIEFCVSDSERPELVESVLLAVAQSDWCIRLGLRAPGIPAGPDFESMYVYQSGPSLSPLLQTDYEGFYMKNQWESCRAMDTLWDALTHYGYWIAGDDWCDTASGFLGSGAPAEVKRLRGEPCLSAQAALF